MQTSALRPQVSCWAANETAPVACLFLWSLPRKQLIWAEWHLVTLPLHQHRFLPLRSPTPAATKCNLCFSCVILWDQCLRLHVWHRISGLREKARCDVDLFYYLYLTFLSQSVHKCLVFFNCKIQDFRFCLQEIPLEQQIRCKIGRSIISCSCRQQRRC